MFALTTDITSNMNAFGMLLEKGNILYLYCTDHVLHLNCKNRYDKETFIPTGENGDLSDIQVKQGKTHSQVNTNVLFFNSSTQALDQLKIAQESIVKYEEQVEQTGPLKPLTDVYSRWWVTFNMIHCIFYLRTALNVLVASDALPKRLEISAAQWEAFDKM